LAKPLQQLLETSLSFSWNLPSPSGLTARLGRAKTQHRPPVPEQQQPSEPKLDTIPSAPTGSGLFGPVGALFGAPAQAGFEGAPPNAAGGLFGAPAQGAPLIATSTGGGLFGAPAQAGFGGAPPNAGGLFGASTGGGLYGGLFGAPAQAGFGGALPNAGGLVGAPAAGGGLFGPAMAALARPSDVLAAHGRMQIGPVFYADFQHVLARIRYLLQQAAQPAATVQEDPLVGHVLGVAGAPGVPHVGFSCDGCKVLPIVGPRFKSLTMHDFDLCESCFRSSPQVSGSSWVRLESVADNLRHILRVARQWWPLLPGGGDGNLPDAVLRADPDQIDLASLVAILSQVFGAPPC